MTCPHRWPRVITLTTPRVGTGIGANVHRPPALWERRMTAVGRSASAAIKTVSNREARTSHVRACVLLQNLGVRSSRLEAAECPRPGSYERLSESLSEWIVVECHFK